MILERAGIAILILASVWITYRVVSRLVLARRARKGLMIDTFQFGTPAILLFSTPDCAPCKNIQRPALEDLKSRLPQGLQLIEIDALERIDLADAWGVLGVPTTFVIDRLGRPRGVNHGLASLERIAKQLAAIGEAIPKALL